MKKFFSFAFVLFVSTISFAQNQQIENGDFETWTFDGANLPNHFNSYQTADGSYSGTSYSKSNRQVERSSDTRPGTTGKYSCRIWARQINLVVSKVLVQGNLTTGRVHAGAMKTLSEDNYVYTDRDGSNTNDGVTNPCYMKFTSVPDSIAVWLKFITDGSDSSHPYAQIKAIVHDDYDYITGYNDYNLSTHVAAIACKDVSSTSSNWVRFSVPFTKGASTNPKYILLCFATNSYPGGGAKGDELYIDDIEMIYLSRHTLQVSQSYGWASLCLDFNAKLPQGATAYIATGMKAGYVSLKALPEGATIPANCAVIVKSSKSSLVFEQSGETPCSVDGNILSGVTSSSSVMDGYKYYVLGDSTVPSRAAFSLYNGSSLSANKAFIKVAK